jgi:hypothetical protein
MGLEDLRGESLWMAQDPIRARQGLRACAVNWVTHDISPMAGEQVFDLSKVQSHADLLHLYLLIAGRGRIGVLDDQSLLVTGVQGLATEVLGYEIVSDADDIIDRFLETSEDPSDAEGAAQRAALAKEFASLLPQDAKPPTGEIGCHCDPQDQQPGSESEQGEGEGEGASGQEEQSESDGQGQPGSEGDESESGEGEPGGGDGSKDGDESGEGAGTGQGEDGDDTGEGEANLGQGDVDGKSSTDDSDSESQGDSGSGSDDTDDTDSAGPTVATNKGASDASDEAKNNATDADPDFITGTFGETIRPGHEDVTDTLDDSDAFRLTREQIEALTEILTEGLEEVSNDEGEAGWAISDEEGAILVSRSVAPAKVASEVFSKQAQATRNRRLKR